MEVAHYLFNLVPGDPDLAARLLHARMWGVAADEPRAAELAPGDLVLLYAGPPDRVFVGRAELASAVRAWTPDESRACPDGSSHGVLLDRVTTWSPPVSMAEVLSRIDPSENAKAEFATGVVRITRREYDAALAAAD